jgi:hypothetical protein
VSNTTTTTTTQSDQRRKLMSLTPEQIRNIYAKRRTKGLYDQKLVEFLNGDDSGVSVRESWATDFPLPGTDENGQGTGKKAASIKQGFENSKSRKDAPEGAENVDVIVDGDEVYLINKVAAGMDAELAEATA